MRNALTGPLVGLAVILFFPPHLKSQSSQTEPSTRYGPADLYQKLGDTGSGGAAPRRDLTGFWATAAAEKLNEIPPMTPWGQEQFRAHKNQSDYPVAESNDPVKTCDPLGFPRSILYLVRGVAFAQMPGKMLELLQFNRVWREIWTDGRELPKNVGGTVTGSPDPRWYGYSVGHWEDDYTFVIDTVGSDERSWLDIVGHPHSIDLRVQERYKRVDHNNLEVAITIDDPKTYTKPFVISNAKFKWIPEQDFEEQICAPSEMLEYLNLLADPADGGNK
jgi:hypothetical protein